MPLLTMNKTPMSLEKNPTTGPVIELFGPTVEFLTSPEDGRNDFCVLKGTIPPGVSVPLHSHSDTEDFFIISGSVEGLRHDTAHLAVPGGHRDNHRFLCGLVRSNENNEP
jgi:hypothetical protein